MCCGPLPGGRPRLPKPLVSLIVSVYNGETFLARALESLFAQEYDPVEVIVVDDGSTDLSGQIARTFPGVLSLHQPHGGLARARNTGLAAAHGDFVGFFDADDLAPPEKLTIQVGYLLSHPEVDCVLGRQELFYEGEEPAAWSDRQAIFGDVNLMSAVMRTRVLREVGGFDPTYLKSEDRDLFVRLREYGAKTDVLPDIVLYRRVHGANMTFAPSPSHALLRSLKARIDRGREVNGAVEQ
jgi:glycosyltransferase involved in cell wall biosynthesis